MLRHKFVMSCHNLANAFRLTLRASKYHNFQSHIGYVACNYSSLLNHQKLKCRSKVDNPKTFINIHTNSIQYSSDDSDEDLSQPLVKLTFVTPDEEEIHVEGRVGKTVMQAAVKNNVPMEAACDGQLACTTCHVYVDEACKKFLEEASMEEEDLLDAAPFCRTNSRLSCQLKITESLDNARFHLPSATTNFSVDKKQNQS